VLLAVVRHSIRFVLFSWRQFNPGPWNQLIEKPGGCIEGINSREPACGLPAQGLKQIQIILSGGMAGHTTKPPA
jgi:hypothetical protein